MSDLTPPPSFNTDRLIIGASAVWSGIESVAEFVADLLGVTAPMYEIYLEDALEYQKSLEQLEPILPKTIEFEPQAVDWEMNNVIEIS